MVGHYMIPLERKAETSNKNLDKWSPEVTYAYLLRAFLHVQEGVKQSGGPVWACVGQVPAPVLDLQSLAANYTESEVRGYWCKPSGTESCAIGSARTWEAQGSTAIETVAIAWLADVKRLQILQGGRAIAWGGFAFAPGGPRDAVWANWPGGCLTLPQWLFENSGIQQVVTVNQRISLDDDVMAQAAHCVHQLQQMYNSAQADETVEPEARRKEQAAQIQLQPQDDAQYLQAVTDTASAIRAGRFTKVVLARRVDYKVEKVPDIARALRTLTQEYGDSTVFLWARRESVFLGAAPERLVRVEGQQVAIDCLAGTAPRSEDLREDSRLAEELLMSPKNRSEHQAVVDGAMAAGESFAEDFIVASAPTLLRLTHMQHLYTPVQAKLRANHSILDAVKALHPTPAVAGTPKAAALAAIAEQESMDRGYYAGPLGFVDANGDGEFVVALRCALLQRGQLSLFAGGGIMGDSAAEAERAETEWKMRPIRSAFGLPLTEREDVHEGKS